MLPRLKLEHVCDQPNIRYGLLSNMEVRNKVVEEDYRMPLPKGTPPTTAHFAYDHTKKPRFDTTDTTRLKQHNNDAHFSQLGKAE